MLNVMGLLTTVVSAIHKILSLTKLSGQPVPGLVETSVSWYLGSITHKVEQPHDRNQDWQEIMQFNASYFIFIKDHSMRYIAWPWYFVEGHWVWPNSFCLQLHSVEPIAADDDCKFTESYTSDAWEYQELISDFERKNNDIFFPVG